MLSVASAYYEVIKARKRVEMSRDSVARMERHKEVTEREAATRKSKANVSSLLRARTLVSQARIFLVRDEDMLKIARQQLKLVSRMPEDAVLVEPSPQQLPADTIDDLKALALQNRDDYMASKLNQQVAEENVTIVKGGHYPQAYAEGALQYLNSSPVTIMDGTIYYGGIRLVVPIFEGGLMKAEVSEARSKKRQSELATQYLQRSIETDVYEAYVNYQTVSSVLKAAKLQYADAKDNFNTVESLFGQGLVPSLALIDAQQALFITERELVNTTYDEQLAVIRLKKSVGLLGKSRKG
jgi:outer membrane protein